MVNSKGHVKVGKEYKETETFTRMWENTCI